MIPATTERVAIHTARHVNQAIRQRTVEDMEQVCAAGIDAISDRMDELDREWDIERTLEANAATAVLVGVGLATFVDRRFLALPAAVAGFLFQHAVQGWCPPIPVFRRLGFRTQTEIEEERHALKALRGDYTRVPMAKQSGREGIRKALRAAQR